MAVELGEKIYNSGNSSSKTKTWNNPEYQKLYNNAVVQAQAQKAEADYRKSNQGMLLQTALNSPQTAGGGAKIAAQTLGSGVTRAGISGYEAIGDLNTGLQAFERYGDAAQANGGTFKERAAAGKKAYNDRMDKLKGFNDRKYYNTPFGEIGSVQKEMAYRAPRIIEGEDNLVTALNPMIDTILDVSDVTMVAAAPSLIKKFGTYAAKKGAKKASKESLKAIDEAVSDYAKGKDIYTRVKNKDAADYIAQNKNMSEDEVRDILLKDHITNSIETKIETPLPNKEKQFAGNVIDDAIKNNGYEATIKNMDELEENIVKQLDETTTQSRMNREALQEGLDSGDEMVQQKAIASYQIHQDELSKAEKALVGKKSPKKVNKAQRKVDKIKTDIAKQEGELITKQTKKLNEDIVKLENKKQSIIDSATTKKAKRSIKRKVNKIDKEIAKTNKKIATVGDDVRKLLNEKQVKATKAAEKTTKETKPARGVKQNKKIKGAEQETKAKSTRNAKPQKGIKKTVRKNTGQTDTSKVVKTTEKRALNNKLKATQKDLKAGKKLGKAEQSQLYKDLSAYAKASGLPMDDIGKEMTRARVSNIKTSDQLENIKKAIDKKVGANAGKVAKQAVKDAENDAIDQITKDLKKSLNRSKTKEGKSVSYNKGGTTDKVLKGLKKEAKQAKDPALKAEATAAYKEAARAVTVAADKTAEVGNAIYKAGKTMGADQATQLAKRLGIPRKKNALSAFLYSDADFTKELKLLERISSKFEKGDVLLDEKAAHAFVQMGFKNADLLPARIVLKDESLSALKKDRMFSSFFNWFSNSATTKNKYGVVGEMISKAQELEVVKDGNQYVSNMRLKDLNKEFNKLTPKKDRQSSMAVIQGLVEGEGISGNAIEEKIAKEFIKMRDTAADYLEKSDGTFKRIDGYFPDNNPAETAELEALINTHGLDDGIAKFYKSKEGINSSSVLGTMHNMMKSDTASFLKHRKGDKARLSKNVFDSMGAYQSAFENLRFIREADPYLAAIKTIGDDNSRELASIASLASDLEILLKKSGRSNREQTDKIIDNATALMYVKDMGVSPKSAIANLVGGYSANFLENGAISIIRGAELFAENPVQTYKQFAKNGLLSGSFIDYGTASASNKALKKAGDALMLNQKGAESLTRSNQIAGLLNKSERASLRAGKLNLTPPRRVEILDNINKTQGHFSDLYTAPIFKTRLAKLVLPYTRWMFNSGTIMWGATKDVGVGMAQKDMKRVFKGMAKFGRAAMLYYGGQKLYGYATKDFADDKYSNKLIKKSGEAMMETVTGVTNIPTAMLESPQLETAKMVANSIAIQQAEMGMRDYPFKYEEMKTMKDIYYFGTSTKKLMGQFKELDDESVLSMYKKYNVMNDSEKIQYERHLKERQTVTGRDVSGTFKNYKRYSRYNITPEEFGLSMVRSKEKRKKRVEKYLQTFPANERKANLNRLLNAKIVSREDLE